MHSLEELLHAYTPSDSDEQHNKSEILNFIKTYPNCFERTLEVGHITASCWLLNHDGTHALLTHHRKLDAWFQLGGHCDGETDVLAVAIKEAQEESGIMNISAVHPSIFDIDVHRIPENAREKSHIHYDIRFLLQVRSEESVTVSHESKSLLWIGKNLADLPTSSRSIIRMFTKWLHT